MNSTPANPQDFAGIRRIRLPSAGDPAAAPLSPRRRLPIRSPARDFPDAASKRLQTPGFSPFGKPTQITDRIISTPSGNPLIPHMKSSAPAAILAAACAAALQTTQAADPAPAVSEVIVTESPRATLTVPSLEEARAELNATPGATAVVQSLDQAPSPAPTLQSDSIDGACQPCFTRCPGQVSALELTKRSAGVLRDQAQILKQARLWDK